ncbi:MAG: PP2C family protein-serine/threonine phosphatase [Ilumatobacteraceae bacterium]
MQDRAARDDRALQMFATLLDGAHLAPPDQLPGVIAAAASAAGWSTSLYVVDYEQRRLVGMGPSGTGSFLSVDGTVAGRAFRELRPTPAPGEPSRMWVPVIDGVERLGVLDVHLETGTDAGSVVRDRGMLEHLRLFAHLVGHLLGSKAPYGDAFHRARLRRDRTVESELVWSLLPPLTVACHGIVIAGLLEPHHAVAGDVFDYSVDHEIAHTAILDATGHDLHSGVIGAISLAAYRNSRRRSHDLDETVANVDATLEEFGADTYATGVFTQLDLQTGLLRYVNAGHPAPLLVRGAKVTKELDRGRRRLLGLPSPTDAIGTEQLEAGDWVVLYTDGVIEARDEDGAFFGIERFVDVIERRAAAREPAPETLRGILHTIMDHQRGVLQDDATLVVVQWASRLEAALDSGGGLSGGAPGTMRATGMPAGGQLEA